MKKKTQKGYNPDTAQFEFVRGKLGEDTTPLDLKIELLVSDQSFLEKVAKENATVNTCINIVAKNFAAIVLNLYNRSKDGTYIPVRGSRHFDHLFSRPNNFDVSYTFKFKMAQRLMIDGSFWMLTLGSSEKQKVFILKEGEVIPKKNPLGEVISYTVPRLKKDFRPESLQYFVIPNPDGSATGWSPLKAAIKNVILNDAILLHSLKFIKSGMMNKGYLKSNKAGIGVEMLDLYSRLFMQATSGQNANIIPALPADIEYVPVSQSALDGSLETRDESNRKVILQVFNIPESVFNSDNGSSYATAAIQKIMFLESAIRPLTTIIEENINYWSAVTSETQYFRFEIDEIISAEELKLRAETDALKASTAATLKAMGLFSDNEVRKAAGYDVAKDQDGNPIEDADVNPLAQQVDLSSEEQVDTELAKQAAKLKSLISRSGRKG